MPIWFSLLLTLLGWLLQWLLSREQLTASQVERVNGMLEKAWLVEGRATRMGCKGRT